MNNIECGDVFHRLTVVGESTGPGNGKYWECRCSCGRTVIADQWKLRNNRTKSCGCYSREMVIARSTKHGLCRAAEYTVWEQMHRRCYKQSSTYYRNYGGRGISVCSQWHGADGFVQFLNDMGTRPTGEHQLERVDNEGNYEPGNCIWATRKAQCNNRRSSRRISFDGKSMTVAQWADRIGVSLSTLHARLSSGKWSVEDALTTPTGKTGPRPGPRPNRAKKQ